MGVMKTVGQMNGRVVVYHQSLLISRAKKTTWAWLKSHISFCHSKASQPEMSAAAGARGGAGEGV